MPIKERQKKERDARRENILKAALKSFAKFGYHATSMDVIAEEAELGKSTLYYYFNSKDELLISVLESGMTKFFSDLETLWSKSSLVEEKIKMISEASMLFFLEHPDYFKLYLHLTSHPTLKKDSFKVVKPILEAKLNAIENLFKEAKRKKLIKNIPIQEAARIYGAMIMGVGIFSGESTDKKSAIKRSKWITEIFFNGIMRKSDTNC